jgi:MFS family permease
MLSLLRRRDFALLWTGGLISVGGDRVLRAALPYFVYQRTGSTVATAGMIAAELAPSILLGSFAGVFVDRWDRRRLLVVANLLQAAVVALLLLIDGGGRLWLVFVVAAAQATVSAFSTPAESALLPTLVPERDLVAANALNALNNRLGRLVGVPAGGLLLGTAGLESVVIVDCATFLVAAALIAAMATHDRRPRRDGDAALSAWAHFWAEWVAGLGIVRRERTVAVLFFVFGLMTFGGTMLDPLTVAWVRDVLEQGPEVYAGLSTAHAVTGIAGSLVLGAFAREASPRALIGYASVFAGLAHVLQYTFPSVPLAFSVSLVVGFTSVLSSVGVETLAQRAVGPEYRGRVFGSLEATLGFLSLAGALTAGVLGEVVGTVTMLYASAALIVLSGLVVLRAVAPSGLVSPTASR